MVISSYIQQQLKEFFKENEVYQPLSNWYVDKNGLLLPKNSEVYIKHRRKHFLGMVTSITEQPSGNRISGQKSFGSTFAAQNFTTDSGGAKRVLIVVTSGNGPPTSVTYNGVSLINQVNHNDGFNGVDIWYMINPPLGTYSFAITGSSFDTIGYGVTAFWYVDQTTPMSNNTISNASASSHTSTINPVAIEDKLLMASITDLSTTPTGGGTQIEWMNISISPGFVDANHKIGTGGSTSCSYSHGLTFYVQVATKLNFSTP